MGEMKKYKKGQKVWLVCCTHDPQSKEFEPYILEDEMTDDELMAIAEDYANNTKELEWWIEESNPSDD